MPLTCNINAKGKFVRLVYGLIALVIGLVLLLVWARGSESVWRWVVGGGVCAMGAFALFEARAGWCVVRAMGFKTRM